MTVMSFSCWICYILTASAHGHFREETTLPTVTPRNLYGGVSASVAPDAQIVIGPASSASVAHSGQIVIEHASKNFNDERSKLLQNVRDGRSPKHVILSGDPNQGARCGVTGAKTVRIAVAFFGLFRSSSKVSLPTIDANLFQPLNVVGEFDVISHAMLTPVDKTERSGADYNLPVDSKGYELFKPCVAEVEEQATVDNDLRNIYEEIGALDINTATKQTDVTPYDRESTRNVIRSRYSIGRAAELIRTREIQTGVTYTHIVVARPDIAFFSKLRWAPLPDAIQVPNFMMCGGVNDRFAYGPAEIMLKGYMSQFAKQIAAPGFSWKPTNKDQSEELMCKHLRQQHVRVAVTPLCLVRLRGVEGLPHEPDRHAARERADCVGNESVLSGTDDLHNPC